LENQILGEMQKRIVKSFLDVVILAQLMKEPKSTYDIITFIHKKFNLLMSTGTVYSNIYSLERNKLIEGNWSQRKRVYMLTDRGKKTIKAIINVNGKVGMFVEGFLKDLSR